MPAQWPMVPLAELVSDMQYGTSEKANEISHGQPVLRMNNITYEGTFDISDLKWVDLPPVESAKLKLCRGDILFNRTNSRDLVGKTAVWDGPDGFAFAGYLIRVRLLADHVLPEWVSSFMNSPMGKTALYHMAKPSVNMANISASELLRFRVPVPSLEYQRQSAALIGRAGVIRRKRKEAISLTDELLRSTFLEMFGDPVANPKNFDVAPLGSLADIAAGVAKGKRYEGQMTVSVPYMRVANVQDGHFSLEEVKSLEVSKDEAVRYRLQAGDVLLTEGGDPDKLGRGAVWNGEIDPCIHQNHIFRVRTKERLAPQFLSAQLSSARGKRYFLRAAKQTTGIASINLGQLKDFPVFVPSLPLQAAYVRVREQINTLKERLRAAAAATEDLFGSLVSQAFTPRSTCDDCSVSMR